MGLSDSEANETAKFLQYSTVPGCIFLENVECALWIETFVWLLMAEPAGDAEVFAGCFDKVGGGK